MNSKSAAPDRPLPPAVTRSIISVVIPPLLAAILTAVISNLGRVTIGSLGSLSIYLGLIGLVSWYLGVSWYGSKGMGLRGGRPFYAGAGFAFLGWIAILIVRLIYIDADESRFLQEPLFPTFAYLLLFEAFAMQLWLFGLVFRSVADWRGPITAAAVSGILFALFAFNLFQESFEFVAGLGTATMAGVVAYFLAWGIFYGLIRLRTGSLIGIVIVQAMQSLTAWSIIAPQLPLSPENFSPRFYTVMGIWYAILIWRLWPKETADYRV